VLRREGYAPLTLPDVTVTNGVLRMYSDLRMTRWPER
jgi:hypothetical protein